MYKQTVKAVVNRKNTLTGRAYNTDPTILTKQIEPNNIRFFVGYSGWAEGQLQAEMKEQSWLLGQVQKEYTFSEEKNLWTTVLQNEGGAKSIIGQIPDEENLN